jgi:hypothetical protein
MMEFEFDFEGIEGIASAFNFCIKRYSYDAVLMGVDQWFVRQPRNAHQNCIISKKKLDGN